jgi:hypothetical protein
MPNHHKFILVDKGGSMPRSTNKKDLLELSKTNGAQLLDFINELPVGIKKASDTNDELNDRDKTVSDGICHLHEWYAVGMAGKKPALPAEGGTGQIVSVLNRRLGEIDQGTMLDMAISMFKKSHADVMALIEKHRDDELFTKKKYLWTGTTSLGAYFISATASHYDGGVKTIKPLKKLAKSVT